MAEAKERCDRCGKTRVLSDAVVNQFETLRLCKACRDEDFERRSKAYKGKVGRKPRSPSQIEDQPWKCYLNSPDSKILEIWFATEGYTGTRGEMLKRHLLALVKAARGE